ncbi:MAG: ABC transporter substrate-binding protein [Candidatus Aquicultorales bacterium]
MRFPRGLRGPLFILTAIKGGEWPVMLVISPSQAPRAVVCMKNGPYQEALKPFGITPILQKLDGPPRVFHSLERSKWPFVYMPIAVFTDYSRSAKNQGEAGGLQYVAIAGSTAGGGYQLMARAGIDGIKDLRGKTVALTSSAPVQDALVQEAVERAGLKVGKGKDDVKVVYGRPASNSTISRRASSMPS